jgi:hypothetical protein
MVLARAEYVDGTYKKPKFLGPPFNVDTQDWLPYVAPDESYLIFSGNSKENPNRFDLYISFRDPSGSWGDRIKLGDKINTEGAERFPGVSHDGKIFFFVRDSEIYWYSASFLKDLKI